MLGREKCGGGSREKESKQIKGNVYNLIYVINKRMKTTRVLGITSQTQRVFPPHTSLGPKYRRELEIIIIVPIIIP